MKRGGFVLLVFIAAVCAFIGGPRVHAQQAPWLCVTINGSFNGCPTPTPGPLGPLNVSPSALSFTHAGSSFAQNLSVDETNYTGVFSTTLTSCSGVVTISPSSGNGPNLSIAVTPVASGASCNIQVTDDHSGSVNIPVTAVIPTPPPTPTPSPSPGPLTVAPTSLAFIVQGSGGAQSLAVSETNYPRLFAIAASSCSTIVSLSAISLTGPSAQTTVTPVGNGTCTLGVTDDHSGSVNVPVSVNAPVPIIVTPTSLTFTNAGSGFAQNLSMSETQYSGNFTFSGCSTSIITISPASVAGPSGTAAVTPVGNGSCTLVVADNNTDTTNVPVSVSTPTPPPSGNPPVIVQSFGTQLGSGASTTVNLTPVATPSPGDMLIATINTYNGGGTNNLVATPANWTSHDACWDNVRNGLTTFYHVAAAGDTLPYTFTLASGTSYMGGQIYDLQGVNPTAPFDQTACLGYVNKTAPSTSSLTPANQNELALAFSTTAYVVNPTDAAGWTSGRDTNNGHVGMHSGYQFPALVATSDTFTYSGNVTSGNTILELIQPAATPPPVLPVTPVYAYAQSTTSCGGGYSGMNQTAAQDVYWGFEYCVNDSAGVGLDADCPINGNCRTFVYFSPTLDACSNSIDKTRYAYIYANTGTNDSSFIHGPNPPAAQANRIFTGSGKCDTTGGASGTSRVYPNITSSLVQQWEINNYMISGATPVTSLNGSLWKGLFLDNNSPSWADVVIGGAIPIEYNTVQLWRQALAQHLNAITPYAMVLNAEGPGGKVFGNNNNATYGIVNGAVDDADFCNNLTTAGKASVQGMLFEKVISDELTISGVDSVYTYPYNIKIAVNTAANHWNNPNCAGFPYLISGMTGLKGSPSMPSRLFGVVLRGLMTPTGYNGARGTPGIIMGPRFSSSVDSLLQSSVEAEDELVMTQPYVALTAWTMGAGQTNADGLFNGCVPADSGGVNSSTVIGGVTYKIAQLCGSLGTDSSGGTAPVYVREFKVCTVLSVSHGPCVVVFNASTSVNITLSQLALVNTYAFELAPTGTELYNDPVNPANTLCANSTVCTGAYAEIAASGATVIPHCTYISTGSRSGVMNDMLTQGCMRVFLKQ